MRSLFLAIGLGIAFAGIVASAAAQPLEPRRKPIKPTRTEVDTRRALGDSITVKFQDGLDLRVVAGRLDDRGRGTLAGATALLRRLGPGRWRPAHDVPIARLHALQSNAEARLGREVADLSQQFYLALPPGVSAEEAIDGLNALDIVEIALPVPKPVRPPLSSDYRPFQGYLDPTPAGLGVECIHTHPGGTGSAVDIGVVEYNWNYDHNDLPTVTLVGPQPDDPFDSTDHGTAVLGIMGSQPNAWGTTGISYSSDFFVAAVQTGSGIYDVGAAIIQALAVLDTGDVLLIEQQTPGPTYTGVPVGTQNGLVPIDWFLPYYDAVVTAIGNGVIVVETAGNGGENLDDPVYGTGNGGHWPFLPGNHSGAIMVGAGAPPTHGGNERSRLGYSNYGAVLDVQAWGDDIYTTGYGDLYSAEGLDLFYTANFGGTSGAGAIIAGAAAALQSTVRAHTSTFLSADAIRSALQSTGLPQQDGTYPASQNIGPLPDLGAALSQLHPPLDYDGNLIPDLCEPATCGNGFVEAAEHCDDGGMISGDGCSDGCELEPGWICGGEPSTCSFARVVSQGAATSASLSHPAHPPANAVDANLATQWSAGTYPVQWIEIDLGSPHVITQIQGTVAQNPAGQTRHEISLDGAFRGAWQEVTHEDSTLERFFTPPFKARTVRITTTISPSWVAWKEIRVSGSPACVDADGDGYGVSGGVTCAGGLTADCNDANPTAYPGAPELCDAIDNDCNAAIDDGLTADDDADGYTSMGSCGGSANDCQDLDDRIHPDAEEICDGVDNDCDTSIDDGGVCTGSPYDVDGGWQFNYACGTEIGHNESFQLSQNPVTGAVATTRGDTCGSFGFGGRVVLVETCSFDTSPVASVISGTNLAAPAAGFEGYRNDFATPVVDSSFCGPTPIHASEGEVRNEATVTQASGSTATRIDGVLYIGQLAFLDGFDAPCWSGDFTAAPPPCTFYGLRNDVAIGPDVVVEPIEGATVTFDDVTAPGTLGIVLTTEDNLPLPPDFELVAPPVFYHIETTASFAGLVEVCLPYADDDQDGIVDGTSIDETSLQILRDGSPPIAQSIDAIENVACAEVDGFSVFALGASADATPAVAGLSPAALAVLSALMMAVAVAISRRSDGLSPPQSAVSKP